MQKQLWQDEIAINQLHQFVEKNWQKDISQLAFKKELIAGWDNRLVLQQIFGKQKAQKKLPFLFRQPNILYPPKLALEQSTSEIVASWKVNLVSGNSLLDMTGGFGVDSYFFAKKVKQVVYIEQQTALSNIVRYNFTQLGISNIQFENTDSTAFLNTYPSTLDWIYIDPARRAADGSRVIKLEDYTPNILTIEEQLYQKGKKILLKTSPMLDIQQVIRQLKRIAKVYVVAVRNDVKELLFLLDSSIIEKEKRPLIHCINLGTSFVNYTPSNSTSTITYELPKKYLYEPNPAILKAGLFQSIAKDFSLFKLHPNTHLYTSEQFIEKFPGRTFKIIAVVPFQKKLVTPYLKQSKANVTARNFPYIVKIIKQKLGIKDGGNTYLFAVTLKGGELRIVVCQKDSSIV